MNLPADVPTMAVSTHAPCQAMTRLGQYRLKDAAIRRELAISQAHHAYHEEVRAIIEGDRRVTKEQTAMKPANYRYWPWRRGRAWRDPGAALAHPFASDIDPYPGEPIQHRWIDVKAFARRLAGRG